MPFHFSQFFPVKLGLGVVSIVKEKFDLNLSNSLFSWEIRFSKFEIRDSIMPIFLSSSLFTWVLTLASSVSTVERRP